MHFYYMDEAGCTGNNLSDDEQPIFVLGGVSVRDEGWNKTQEALSSLIGKYFDNSIPSDFELHAMELLSPNGDGPFLNHSRDQRNSLTKSILELLAERKHDVHLYAINKDKLSSKTCSLDVIYDIKTPYHLAYDYLITYINWFIKNNLGRSARGMLIIDTKEQFHDDIEQITYSRRFEGPKIHRIKKIVEFSYPVDSQKNPMIQISDLVVFCTKKNLEIEGGYRNDYASEAKQFFAECFSLIHSRISKKTIVDRDGRNMAALNDYLKSVQAKPVGQWKKRYGL